MRKLLAALLALIMAASMAPTLAEGAVSLEAPMLEAKVASGEIPPLADRLPKAEDIMIEEMAEVGQYSDALTTSQDASKWWSEKLTEEPLFRFKNDGTVEPNVAKGYDVNDDATEYTIYLREGMKWSDGVPFTSEDCRFFYEEMLLTGFTTQSVWAAVKALNPETGEEEAAQLTVIDDYSFKMTFASPKVNFLGELAINGKWFFAPAHWMKDYMPAYIGEDAAAKKAIDLGFSDVKAMAKQVSYYYWLVIDRPTLRAWQITNNFEDQLCTWVRNPYYWKTDVEGKQLPYFDKIQFMRFQEATQPLLWSMDGTIDVYSPAWTNIVEVKENQTAADGTLKYNVYEWGGSSWATNSIQLNQAIQDEDLRALFQNILFREALSIAVDRETIVSLIDDGFTVASQSGPQEGQQGYDPDWLAKWTEYNPGKAEELLAQCGLVKGADGMYCFANGKQVVLNLQYQDLTHASFAELLVKYFTEIGLTTTSRMYDRSILEEMRSANTHEITIRWENFSTVNIALRPDYVIPTRDYPPWATAMGTWYMTGGTAGVEPSPEIQALLDLYDALKVAIAPAEREALCLEMLKLHQENIWEIGYTSPQTTLWAVNAKLHNFPESAIYCDEFRGLGIGHLQSWWLSE